MSETDTDADFLLTQRGKGQLGAWVIGIAFPRRPLAAFGLGDGTLRVASPPAAPANGSKRRGA
jgi:hypothetical protein